MAVDPARRRRGAAPLDEGHRPAERADRQARPEGELLVDGRARARRPVARRSSTTAARSTVPTASSRPPSGSAMPAKLEDRYLEIWNLVFMQDELSAVRSKEDFDIVGSLPKQNIDTGMGLERVAYLLQGVDNMYEIDVMYPVIERAEELTGRRYGAGPRRRRPDAGRRRPRPQLDDADRRRRHARQRGPRLRPAPAAAPGGPLDAAARATRTARCPSCCRSAATRWARPTPSCTATGSASRRSPTPRRTRSGRRCASGTTIFDQAAAEVKQSGGHHARAATARSRCTTPTASRST